MMHNTTKPAKASFPTANFETTSMYSCPKSLPAMTYPPLHVSADKRTAGKNMVGDIFNNPAATAVYPRRKGMCRPT